MKSFQNTKIVNVIRPAAIVNNAAVTTASVDTKGFDHCTFVVNLGATDIAMTAFKIQEADDDSTYSDVTGAIAGTSANDTGSTSTLPSATDDNKLFIFEVDCKARKRYLDLSCTIGNGSTGAYTSAIAILTRSEAGTNTATLAGATGQRWIVS